MSSRRFTTEAQRPQRESSVTSVPLWCKTRWVVFALAGLAGCGLFRAFLPGGPAPRPFNHEAHTVRGYKEALVRTREDETVISRAFTGKTLRAVRNSYTDYWEKNPGELQPFPMQVMRSMQDQAMHLGGDETFEIDPDKECYPAGQGVGAIHELVPAGELVHRIVEEAEAVLGKVSALR